MVIYSKVHNRRNFFMRLYKISIILMAVLLISTNVFAGSSPADVATSDDEKTSEYQITFDVNNYSNGSTVSIKIANTSSMDISNWKLVIALNNNSLITNSWCAKYYQSDSQITITPESWNNKITAGSSICLGFNTNSNTSITSSYIFESPDLANNTTTNNNTNNTNVNITTNLIDANKNFAFDLLKKLNDDESGKNLFFSPISVSTALSMLYEGAENSTKDGIAKTLNYDGITITDLNNSYKSLIENLNRKDEHVNLNLGNSIWIRERI